MRDFRVCKPGEGESVIDSKPPDEINMSDFQIYPNAFTRDYCKKAFEESTLKFLHERLWSFEFIRCIDLSNLLIGDDGFGQFCSGLERCPVETLVLTGNNITDKGLEPFAELWRSLFRLRYLFLSDNKFTDVGIMNMFHTTRYSPTLRHLNVSKNRIGVRAAAFIGMMFLEERVSELEELVLGIKVNVDSSPSGMTEYLIRGIINAL